MLDEIVAQDAKKNVTAIVTTWGSGINKDNDLYFARALKAGISIFFFNGAPDMQRHGLDPSRVMMWAVKPNAESGIEANGREWCRRAKGVPQNVVLLNTM